MGRITDVAARTWRRLLIWRYQDQQRDAFRQDRDAAERLEHQREGGSPYGSPPMSMH
jgi:hypothetical protein